MLTDLALSTFTDDGCRALVAALNVRDAYTRTHSQRVVGFVRLLGRACGLFADELRQLTLGALFHDVGKIGIPDQVLLKPAPFDDRDWRVMRQHPEKGEGIVRKLALPNACEVARLVRHHHEHIDGSGYPDGLSGESIPYGSRMIAVADSFDAMTRTRSYHAARTPREALAMMQAESGSKLDAYLVQRLLAVVARQPGVI